MIALKEVPWATSTVSTTPGARSCAARSKASSRSCPTPHTARVYAVALRALVGELGAGTPVAVLDDEASADQIAAWFTARWGDCSGATANARLDALRSAAAWWRHQDWITADPTRRIRRRPRTPDRTRSLAKPDLDALLTRPALALRERGLGSNGTRSLVGLGRSR